MPPRIGTVNTAGTGVDAWYMALPPVTRFYATAILVTTSAFTLGLINPLYLACFWPKIVGRLEVRQHCLGGL